MVMIKNSATPAEAKKGSVDAKTKKLAETSGKAPVNLTEEELAAAGSMSDSLQYIGVLVHPTKLQGIGVRKGPNGEKDDSLKTARFMVGLRFKVLKSVDVPNFGNITSHSDPQEQAGIDIASVKHYEPGQTVDMTLVEFGVLTAKPEFNGEITGGDDENLFISLSLHDKKPRNANGVASKGNDLSTVIPKFNKPLYARTAAFEIPVGQVLVDKEGKNRYAPFQEGSKEAEEFAKWAALVVRPTSIKTGTATRKAATDKRADAYTNEARNNFLAAVKRVSANNQKATEAK